MRRHSIRKQTFRPCLEMLETRWCPSCTFHQEGSTLIGRGDAGDDRVALLDHQTGVIDVNCNGETQTFRGIRNIQYTDLGGDNNFEVRDVDLHADLTPAHPSDLLVDMLGTGQNRVTIDASAGLTTPDTGDQPTWNVSVRTGAGNDTLTTRLGAVSGFIVNWRFDLGDRDDKYNGLINVPGLPADYADFEAPSGHVFENASGGRGNDSLSVEFVGFPVFDNAFPVFNTALAVTLDGGGDNDAIKVAYENVRIPVGAHQAVRELGGNGSDRLSFGAERMGWSPDGEIVQDGGNGDDQLTVALSNCDIRGALALQQSGGDNSVTFDGGRIAAGASAVIRQVGGNGASNTETLTETIEGTMTSSQTVGRGGTNQMICVNWSTLAGGLAEFHQFGDVGSVNGVTMQRGLIEGIATFTQAGAINGIIIQLNVAATSSATFSQTGRRTQADCTGQVDGFLKFVATGTDQRGDVMSARFSFSPDGRGRADISMFGLGGNDDMTLAMYGWWFFALVDGGPGDHNVAHVTHGVTVRNCEVIEYLDP